MKILEIQRTQNLQFASHNTAKIKGVIAKGSTQGGDSFVRGENNFPISPEITKRLEKQMRKLQRKQTYDKYNALQKEKDIKYKNMLG